MKILGNKVYLFKPSVPETKTYISEELKRQMEADLVKQLDRLKVYAVGDNVVDIKVGDEVLVDPNGLKTALAVNIGDTEVLILNSLHVIHVW